MLTNIHAADVKYDNKPSYSELRLQCELLKAQAVVNEKAMGQMSVEICELNNQIISILDELKEMQ